LIALGNEQLSKRYGGIFSLPTAFLIGRDGRVYAKHMGATNLPVFENEFLALLPKTATAEIVDFRPAKL